MLPTLELASLSRRQSRALISQVAVQEMRDERAEAAPGTTGNAAPVMLDETASPGPDRAILHNYGALCARGDDHDHETNLPIVQMHALGPDDADGRDPAGEVR